VAQSDGGPGLLAAGDADRIDDNIPNGSEFYTR
jgi:hypothetical protein